MADIKRDRENEIVIKQDSEDGRLQVLLKEYELLSNRAEQLDNRIIQILGVIIGILTFIGGYVLNQPHIGVEVAWLVPLICIVIFTYFIVVTYFATVNIWTSRILSLHINTMIGEPVLTRFTPDSPEAWFLSSRRGNIKFRLLYLALLSGCTILCILIFHVSLNVVYGTSHLAGSLFVLTYASLLIFLIFAGSGLLVDLPNFYDRYLKQYQTHTSSPPNVMKHIIGYSELMSAIPTIFNIRNAFASILPRPWDITAKGPFFIYGFVTALVIAGFPKEPIVGLPYSHLQLINFLFSISSSSDWKSILVVPLWVVCVLGVIYFIVEEVLLQQAKLLWDDIRDVERDKVLLQNNRRAIATGRISIRSAIRQMLVRWVLALTLGYLLGGIALLSVFLLISFHQILYVLWAKPRSAKDPGSPRQQIELLFFLALTVPLRFLAGVVAVVGSQWSLIPFVLFFVLFYFCSFGALATFWKMEAQHYRAKNQLTAFRPQSYYYEQDGAFWQHVGLVAAVLCATLMVVIPFLPRLCTSMLPILEILYRGCVNEATSPVDIGTLNSAALMIVLIAAFSLTTILLVYVSGKIGKLFGKIIGHTVPRKIRSFLIQAIRTIKGLATNLLFLFTVCSFCILFIWHDTSMLFWGFLLLNAGYLLMFEGMTYLDYTMENLRKRLPFIIRACYAYLFQPNLKIGLKELIFITSADIDLDKLAEIDLDKLTEMDLDKLKALLSADETTDKLRIVKNIKKTS